MTNVTAFDTQLGRDLNELIESLELSDLQKRFLRSRWLDQSLWAESRAGAARNWHYALRLIAIIGGVIVPAFVSLNMQGKPAAPIGWATVAISLTVALCLSVESFFHWGERWTHYRKLSEVLKSEGWLFFQLGGDYQELGSHAAAYPEFAKRIEAVISGDVESFITRISRAPAKDRNDDAPSGPGSQTGGLERP